MICRLHYICKPDEIVGKHHWIWYDFKTGQPRCKLTPPPDDRYIPEAFKQHSNSTTAIPSTWEYTMDSNPNAIKRSETLTKLLIVVFPTLVSTKKHESSLKLLIF